MSATLASPMANALERFLALPEGELPSELHDLTREVLRSHDDFTTAGRGSET